MRVRYQVPEEHAGRTVETIARRVLGVSRAQLSSMKFSQGILLDGQPCRSTQKVREGQVLTLTPRDKHLPPPVPSDERPVVVYEDGHYLVVDKPAPLASLDSRRGGETLQGRVHRYLGFPNDFVYRPVNRLDKGTSGLMLVAKSAHAQHLAQRILHTSHFERAYLAVVQGCPADRQGTITLPIGHEDGVRRVIDPSGKPSVTHYTVVRTDDTCSLLALCLGTGRTHQIRVHLQAIGCPIIGDSLYGRSDPRLPGRFALHACRLALEHPFTGVLLTLESPLPPALQGLLDA